MGIDISNLHPCRACNKCLTDQEHCGYCAERFRLRAELAAAKDAIESDRTKLAEWVTSLDRIMDGRFWLTEGRGSYTWDDDTYRHEFGEACKDLRSVIMPLRKMAADLSSSPQTTEEVIAARRELKAALAAANERAEKAEAELNSHIGKQALKEMLRQMLRNAEEKDALAATVERLREALDVLDKIPSYEINPLNYDHGDVVDLNEGYIELVLGIRSALAATPAQNLAKVKAEALRATATELESLRDHIQEYVGPDNAIDEIRRICLSRAKDLRDEADRLEKEGQ